MTLELLLNLATALGVGLLIGTERSWSGGDQDGQEIAGIRTFGLAGLFGGLAALSASHFGVSAWIAMFVVLALLTIAGYVIESTRVNADRGMTTEIALLLTFLLGSLAVAESRILAASIAVVVALLLSLKSRLHGALRKLNEAELGGALKLLFISVVLLPALPNQGYGPWEAFNPYTTWWMVVLIAAIGFAAYVAIRLLGTRHGLLVTALLGGIVSSTAMTITLARLDSPKLRPALAAGLLATSALMFPRVLLEVGLINRALLPTLLAPMLTAGSIYAAGALLYYLRAGRQPENAAEPPLKNPFELGPALRFAGLLVGDPVPGRGCAAVDGRRGRLSGFVAVWVDRRRRHHPVSIQQCTHGSERRSRGTRDISRRSEQQPGQSWPDPVHRGPRGGDDDSALHAWRPARRACSAVADLKSVADPSPRTPPTASRHQRAPAIQPAAACSLAPPAA